MGEIIIHGGRPLGGSLEVQSAKNSVLPILAATVLAADSCRIQHCPHLSDVDCAIKILRHLGGQVCWDGSDLLIDTRPIHSCHIPSPLMAQMRSSVIFSGALLSRFRQCCFTYPGGCELGPRPIDLHCKAWQTLGVEITEQGDLLHCRAPRLQGGRVVLAIPSVGATENAMLCAVGAAGITQIIHPAREPEIVDLQNFLRKCGANVSGAGTDTITIAGGTPLHGCTHRCIGDRIAASTYLCAVAGTGGDITLQGVDSRHLLPVLSALRQAGCVIRERRESIRLTSSAALQPVSPLVTAPYPGFPTDAQAIVMAALLRSNGNTCFVENMFADRYRHIPQLRQFGGQIAVNGRLATVSGVSHLHGAAVQCTDLRGGAAMAVAALQAEGESRLSQIHHIERGYENLVGDLASLGAVIDQK